ncbi:hypothetical protein L1049_022043 [Liquidambar formosana]|uniref:Retrotransposon gag domain-containing protein n=1 Tax=Liquidambar formosana TaxID=63359 RepID=A0AAP0RBT9_LIQFO
MAEQVTLADILEQMRSDRTEMKGFMNEMRDRVTKLEKGKGRTEEPPETEEKGEPKVNEEEHPKWEDDDYEDYLKRKETKEKDTKVEKLAAENAEMKARMDRMQTAWQKSQGMDDYMYSMAGITADSKVQLPPKFKIADYEKFDGTGDPKQHLRQYLSIARMRGLTADQVLHAFPLSLSADASKWYYALDPKVTDSWELLASEFTNKYAYNTMLDVTLRDLEMTRQKTNETFSEFLTRWRAKAVKMVNRPTEIDQINIILRNLTPVYFDRMLTSFVMNFEQLYQCGTRIEDAIHCGQMDRQKKVYGSGSGGGSGSARVSGGTQPQATVGAIQQTQAASKVPRNNPLPNYRNALPPAYMNMVSDMKEMEDPSQFILMISMKKAPWEDYDSGEEDIWAEMKKDSMHLTRSGRHYKPNYLEGDHPGRELNQEVREKIEQQNEEEEDRILKQLKKTQESISIWGLLIASKKHRQALLDALARKEVPMETTPEQVLSLMGISSIRTGGPRKKKVKSETGRKMWIRQAGRSYCHPRAAKKCSL